MTAVAGLRGTGDWGTDERPKNFRELIMFRNPNGSAPLFALTARIASESVNDPEFNWWDEPNDLVRLQVNGALNSTVTAIVVDSPDQALGHPGVLALYDACLKQQLDGVSDSEQIRTFRLLARGFTIENRELTPTLKLRRDVIMANFSAVIDEMYGAEP